MSLDLHSMLRAGGGVGASARTIPKAYLILELWMIYLLQEMSRASATARKDVGRRGAPGLRFGAEMANFSVGVHLYSIRR